MVLSSAVFEGQWLLAVVVVLASVVSAGYYLPVIMAMYMRDAEIGVDYSGVTVWGAAAGAVAVAVVGILLLGLWPPELIALSMESAAALFQRSLPVAIQ
jgi:NADH-quinone oxidoreductase subunit N